MVSSRAFRTIGGFYFYLLAAVCIANKGVFRRSVLVSVLAAIKEVHFVLSNFAAWRMQFSVLCNFVSSALFCVTSRENEHLLEIGVSHAVMAKNNLCLKTFWCWLLSVLILTW